MTKSPNTDVRGASVVPTLHVPTPSPRIPIAIPFGTIAMLVVLIAVHARLNAPDLLITVMTWVVAALAVSVVLVVAGMYWAHRQERRDAAYELRLDATGIAVTHHARTGDLVWHSEWAAVSGFRLEPAHREIDRTEGAGVDAGVRLRFLVDHGQVVGPDALPARGPAHDQGVAGRQMRTSIWLPVRDGVHGARLVAEWLADHRPDVAANWEPEDPPGVPGVVNVGMIGLDPTLYPTLATAIVANPWMVPVGLDFVCDPDLFGEYAWQSADLDEGLTRCAKLIIGPHTDLVGVLASADRAGVDDIVHLTPGHRVVEAAKALVSVPRARMIEHGDVVEAPIGGCDFLPARDGSPLQPISNDTLGLLLRHVLDLAPVAPASMRVQDGDVPGEQWRAEWQRQRGAGAAGT